MIISDEGHKIRIARADLQHTRLRQNKLLWVEWDLNGRRASIRPDLIMMIIEMIIT